MNTSQIFSRGLLILTLFIFNSICSAQESLSVKDNECYVVVGAFNLEKNAAAYANSMVPQGYDAQYKHNSHRNLYYVWIYKSTDRESAKSKLFTIREKHWDLKDSWLYAGNFKSPHITSQQWSDKLAEKEPVVKDFTKKIASHEEASKKDISEDISEVAPVAPLESSFKVYLNTVNAHTSREISGEFKVIDVERNKEHSTVTTQELLILKPQNGTNRVKFVSNIFGFKMDEHLIDLDEPLKEANSRVEVIGDTILLDFELARYNKGDFASLWRVLFYKDAAIMRQESIYELNQLLEMMKSDDRMRIKLHGHTNGKSRGKVIHLDLEDKQFFSLKGSHNEDVASAKKLSEYRAYTIQHWLMNQGIAEDRMEIIGWGGKKMLYDKHDDQAHQNVRVEIEIIETS